MDVLIVDPLVENPVDTLVVRSSVEFPNGYVVA